MPELRPIQAVRFTPGSSTPGSSNPGSSGADISRKIAPPYDVLDAGPKAELLERDPHNVVAIDLPVTPPKTVGPDSAYAAAGELYRQWLSDGVLERDDLPGVVVYEQVYQLGAHTVRRRGLFAGLGVEEFNRKGGGIHRHEMTLAGGVGDRTKLMEATRAQLSPIFGIFPDPRPRRVVGTILDAVCDAREPDFFGTTDNDGVQHRCWSVNDADTLATLTDFFRATDVFIADGHHRYTTALQFAKDHPELPGADSCLFVLVAAEDPGMVVWPTHRVICGLQAFDFTTMLDTIEADGRFDVRESTDEDADLSTARFILYNPGNPETTYGVWLKGEPWNRTSQELGSKRRVELPPGPRAQLSVSVLHDLLIDGLLRPRFGGDTVTFKYTADQKEMQQWAAAGSSPSDGRVGVVMSHTSLQSVMDVSLADEVMPPKSTYFYPKLATGLVINPLD